MFTTLDGDRALHSLFDVSGTVVCYVIAHPEFEAKRIESSSCLYLRITNPCFLHFAHKGSFREDALIHGAGRGERWGSRRGGTHFQQLLHDRSSVWVSNNKNKGYY